MRVQRLVTFLFFSQAIFTFVISGQTLQGGFGRELENSHDLRLPDWGPYTNKYAGISHVPDIHTGCRFDLSVLPGMDRRRVVIPNVNEIDSPFHCWDAASDLSYYSYRYEIDGKERIYCDVSFIKVDDASRLVRTRFVNNTDSEQALTLSYLMNMNLPGGPMPAELHLPENSVWVNGIPYEKLVLPHAASKPKDNLVPDGAFRGEQQCQGAVRSTALGNGFGQYDGDQVSYRFDSPMISDGIIVLRYRIEEGEKLELVLSGIVNTKIELAAKEGFSTIQIALNNDLPAGNHALTLRSSGGAKLLLDGFALVEKTQLAQLVFTPVDWSFIPETIGAPHPHSVVRQYKVSDVYYGLAWHYDDFFLKDIKNSTLDRSYRNGIYLSSGNLFLAGKTPPEDQQGYYTDIGLGPIMVGPKSERIIDAIVCQGTQSTVEKTITRFHGESYGLESVVEPCKAKVESLPVNPSGQSYAFSQQRMAATILSNICYPIYTQGQYIRHYQPGKMWPTLYTWDAGFMGLGLAELDLNRSVDYLNTYTTKPGAESAFIHHGTPVPVQIYQFMEIWNKTQSQELLDYCYPRMKQYHEFLAGQYGSSTTRNLKSNLIRTWDYFYNSGGWDDYPAQIYVRKNKTLRSIIAPAANTAHAIRTAKFLKTVAMKLGKEADIADYDRDIHDLTQGLEAYAWDEKSGYFGYVLHDDTGLPTGILRYDNQVNYNMGLDGVYPFITGTCSDDKNKAMFDHLSSSKELWSPVGLSAVDQSSPYYRDDGYWNGSVWFPHQWFFWKAMFDHGQGEMAYRIATTAVNLWKKEVDDSWNCYECFSIKTGRGGVWHQFGGLSCPVLVWYHALYKPGTVSIGFDTWIDKKRTHDNGIDLELSFYDSKSNHLIWICLPEHSHYRFTVDDESVKADLLHPGLYQIHIQGKEHCALKAFLMVTDSN